MKVLALERARTNRRPEQATTDRLLLEEAQRVWDLQQAEVIREVYFRGDASEAALMLECRDEAQARSTLATLPLVREGLIDFDVVPLRPCPGLARLFAGGPVR